MKKRLRSITLCALFSVLIIFSAWIAIPTPLMVPITLQVFAVALCGFLLGAKQAAACTAVYIAMGAFGLPVFSHFSGGIGALSSTGGGFIFGFLILGICCGLKTLCKPNFLLPLLGILICHIIGILQFSFVSGCSIFAAFLTASLPFILKDIILVWLAGAIAKRIRLDKFL